MAQTRTKAGRVTGYGLTEEEASDDLNRKLRTPDLQKSEVLILSDAVKYLWLPSLTHVAPLSLKKYKSVYNTHVREVLGPKPLSEIRPSDVQALLNKVSETKGARTTIYVKAIIAQIIRRAILEGLIDKDPTLSARVPAKPEKRDRALSVAQAGLILEQTKQLPVAAPVFFAMVLGMRRGEIAGLKWNDLDRQRGELTIQRQRQAIKGQGVIERPLKTTASKRTLRLRKELVAAIDGLGDLDNDYICTFQNNPWVPNTITDHWSAFAENLAFLNEWTFHDLRHGAAGLLYAAGCDLIEIAAVLGHTKPDMSFMYTSASNDRRGEALVKMADLLKL